MITQPAQHSAALHAGLDYSLRFAELQHWLSGDPLLHHQLRSAGQIALSSEPVFHRRLQSVERHAGTNLQNAVCNGNRVVEYLVVGEVTHAEVVEPLLR